MICEECGSDRVRWRCDNHETHITKYTCINCGNIIVKQNKDKVSLFNPDEINILKQKEEQLGIVRHKNNKKMKKSKKLCIPKNYHKSSNGTYRIYKMKNGKILYGGTVENEHLAKKIVSKLNECDWDMRKLNEIRKEVYQEVNL